MAYSGKFLPKNKDKYRGDYTKIQYRSSWEKFYMGWLDKHPDVLYWSSEEVVIPYFSNADGKKRRYFMDFYVKFKSGQEFFVEVKPFKETQEPLPPSKLTSANKKRFMNEIYTFNVNSDKWSAAKALADKRGVKFRILTENGLRKLGMKI